MANNVVKRHCWFIGLSGLALLLALCVGFLVAHWSGQDGNPLSPIDHNSVYFISLRLTIYAATIVGWKQWNARFIQTLLDKDNGKKTRSRIHYPLPLYLLLFEILIVQQDWAVVVQGLGS